VASNFTRAIGNHIRIKLARTNGPAWRPHAANSSSSAFASFRSRVCGHLRNHCDEND
jgi:hypothetical protein